MKYELFDRVVIKKYWKRRSLSEQLDELGINDLEEYLKSDDMAGDVLELNKLIKTEVKETGLIVGRRQIKTRYTLWHEYQEPINTGMGFTPEIDRISQESAEYSNIYLVATKMNCIRKVSFEDIVTTGGD